MLSPDGDGNKDGTFLPHNYGSLSSARSAQCFPLTGTETPLSGLPLSGLPRFSSMLSPDGDGNQLLRVKVGAN
jgi:hypothetical protein